MYKVENLLKKKVITTTKTKEEAKAKIYEIYMRYAEKGELELINGFYGINGEPMLLRF